MTPSSHPRMALRMWGQLLLLTRTPGRFIRKGPSLYALILFWS